jgi:hypothetical protein
MVAIAAPREIGTAKHLFIWSSGHLFICSSGHLFINGDIVQSASGVESTLLPVHRAERVFHATAPWGSAGLGLGNVIPKCDDFRFWYEVGRWSEQS